MKVTVTIAARTTCDGDTQTTTQTLSGFLRALDESIEVTYREPSGEEGLGNTLTMLRVFPSRLELTRQGDYSGALVLEKGVRHETPYATPFGKLLMTTHTTRFDSTLSKDGTGSLDIGYTLEAGGGESTHDLLVNVHPVS